MHSCHYVLPFTVRASIVYDICIAVMVYIGMAPGPSFDVPLVNVTVVAGQSIVLQCSIDNLGKYKVNISTDSLSKLLAVAIVFSLYVIFNQLVSMLPLTSS